MASRSQPSGAREPISRAAPNAEPSAADRLLGARMVSAFWSSLHRLPGCTCEFWRHPNDPDGGMCSVCEDAPFVELLEAHAEGEPPTLEELEEAA